MQTLVSAFPNLVGVNFLDLSPSLASVGANRYQTIRVSYTRERNGFFVSVFGAGASVASPRSDFHVFVHAFVISGLRLVSYPSFALTTRRRNAKLHACGRYCCCCCCCCCCSGGCSWTAPSLEVCYVDYPAGHGGESRGEGRDGQRELWKWGCNLVLREELESLA